ncbi:hypothetical protein [Kineosporia sp. R_H_3]|uniref:hypothetical protein n=1 Tax=Kineosporia sp. R_H_3 TaxID=1961848 RepID=UPI000B4BE498|nr:hypothetical protein [Kineosporia sp. R_H_3]
MTDTDLFPEAALRRLVAPDDVRPAPSRPIADVRRRAGRLRLRRRTGVGMAGAAAGLAGVVLTGTPLPFGGAAGVVAGQPAAPDLPIGCATGYAEQIPYADATDLLYLPDTAVSGPLVEDVFVRSTRSDCPAARLAATAARLSGGVVTASFTVTGPDAGPMLPAGASFGDDTTTSTVDAGGRRVLLAVTQQLPGAAPLARATWSEPDGSTWAVEAEGLTAAEVTAGIAGLRLDGGTVAADSLPAGLTQRRLLTDADQPPRTSRYVLMTYGSANGESAEHWELEVRDARAARIVLERQHVGAQDVDLGPGVDAVWVAGGKLSRLVWQPGAGPTFQVGGDLSLAQAVEIARTVTKVTPDDPRLVAAAEGPIPTNT